jgi:hypothetical protein
MKYVPSSQRSKQPPPVAQSVLRMSVAEAEELLTNRVAAGLRLASENPNLLRVGSRPPSSRTEGLEDLASRVAQWRDYNRTWLDRYLGGEAAQEYRVASDHHYGYGWAEDPHTNLQYLIDEVNGEVSKLESIRGRLSI